MTRPLERIESVMPSNGLRTAVNGATIAALLILTEAVYLPCQVLRGTRTLYGWDYMMLHIRRLAFARDALLGVRHTLPGWFSREMMGAPFAANLQSFPWIPTHWVLLAVPPERAYAVAIALAAGLASIFTYAYCRQLGFARLASAAAGWTFACAGFFAARVEVGHLTLLEAYPGLPLLLFLVERSISAQSVARIRCLAALAITSGCLAVAGHPQLPIYSIGAALLYALWRSRNLLRRQLIASILLGVGVSAVIWWPMIPLIRRSTRILALDPPANDIVLPYRRLLALFVPGIDGWPAGVRLSPQHPFAGYSHPGYFWDTAAYVGILPWLAVAALGLGCIVKKKLPAAPLIFLVLLGGGALLFALPLAVPLRQLIPGTLLRSPARLLYICTFCLAVGLGAAVDAALRWTPAKRRIPVYPAVLLALVLHGWDLSHFARLFVVPVDRNEMETPAIEQEVARSEPGTRIAVSRGVALAINSRYDDAGGFDSIFLADPYRAFLALNGAPSHRNEEVVDASHWCTRALGAAAVGFVITPERRSDLELLKVVSGLQVYRVADHSPRAIFVPSPVSGTEPAGPVGYARPSSDEIAVHLDAPRDGFVYVVESFDPGWRAEVDGVARPILESKGFAMAVPIFAGAHEVRFRYFTPGRIAGAAISVCSIVLLLAIGLLPSRVARQ